MIEDRIPVDQVLANLKETQESEILNLLKAGSVFDNKNGNLKLLNNSD